jgi:hypothetical protein
VSSQSSHISLQIQKFKLNFSCAITAMCKPVQTSDTDLRLNVFCGLN